MSANDDQAAPPSTEDVAGLMRCVLEAQQQHLMLQMQVLREAMTRRHEGEKGRAAEGLVRELLREQLPQRYSLGSGFIAVGRVHLSKQFDIIIYDACYGVPVAHIGGLQILPVESVYAVVEVTSAKLGQRKLEGDVAKFIDMRRLVGMHGQQYLKMVHGSTADSVTFDVHESKMPPRCILFALSGSSWRRCDVVRDQMVRLHREHPELHVHDAVVFHPNRGKAIWYVHTAYKSASEVTEIEHLGPLFSSLDRSFMAMYPTGALPPFRGRYWETRSSTAEVE